MATNNSNYELIETKFLNGQVKWFNNKLNYGFITIISDTEHKGKDIFVHQTNILPEVSEYRTLTQGEYVSFYLAKTKESTKHEFHGIEIKGIDRGKLMCDFYIKNAHSRKPNHRYNEQREPQSS
jgi:cold shock CspA family protein